MNSTTAFIGGIVTVLIIGGLVFFTLGNGTLFSTSATSTPVVASSTQQTSEAQSPSAPYAITNTTATPGETVAIVTGTVNPNGALTNYWYEFGTTATLGNKTINQTVGSGFAATPAPAYITGLSQDTTYYFRLVAQNQFGTVAGPQYSFQTTHGVTTPVGSIPNIQTLLVSGITNSAAGLSGEVTPNHTSTQYWFEYGKAGTLGNTTPLVSVGDGTAVIPASTVLSNLTSGTLYYYRIDAQNQFGTVNGSILTFKTNGPTPVAVPVVTTQIVSPVGVTTATLRGTVNPYGTKATYWFEYSTDSNFGTGSVKITTQHTSGALTSTISLSTDINRLLSGTVYYVRVVAQNAGGTVRGETQSFTTK